MFKITGRIILILLVASLISGVLYILVNGVAGQPGLLAGLDRRGRFDSGVKFAANQPATPGSFLAQGVSSLTLRSNFGDSGFRNRFSAGRGLAGLFGDLIIVTLLTVLVVFVHGVIKKAFSRPPAKTA
jgi:hypothetical protein